MAFLQDPFLWAFISMFALAVGGAVVGSKKFGQHALFGFTVVSTFIIGRIILVLPFVTQPRFESEIWHLLIGGILVAAGLIFSIPGLFIKPFTAPEQDLQLRTTGFYNIVRNPIYLGEILWCLGLAISFRSIIGILLVPFWWAGLLFLTFVEETSLERELGEPYLEYKSRVRGRIIPGLPV